MKKVFFHNGAPTPILETELELIKQSVENGDEVHFVKCISEIETCFFNRNHLKNLCNICQLKVDKGIELLNLNKKIKIHNLKIKKKFYFPNFRNLEKLKKYKINDFEIGYGVTSSLLSHELDHRPDLSKLNRDINNKLSSSYKIYIFFEKLIKKINPKEIYIFNGRISETWPILCLSKKHNIIFYTYEVAAKDQYRVIKNSTPHLIQTTVKPPPNYLKSRIKQKIKIANSYIFNKDKFFKKIKMQNFNLTQKKKEIPLINKNLRNISIFPSRLDEFESIKGLKNKIYKPDDTAGLRKILNSFKNKKEFFFFVRLHPNMRQLKINSSQMKDLFKLNKEFHNLKMIWPESEIDSYELIKNTEKVITFGSTITLEACFMKKPVISLNNNLFTQLNCAYTPKKHSNLIKLIEKKSLKPKNWKNSLFFFDYYTNRGRKFKFFKKKGENIFYKGKKIEIPKINYLKYSFEIFFFKIFNFKFEKIKMKLINSLFYKKIFYYK